MSDGPPRGIRQSIESAQLHELDRGLVAGVGDQLHGVGRQPGLGHRVAEHLGDGQVRVERARRTAQEGGVAGLEAQPGGVAGDVGPVLVDDGDHARAAPAPAGCAGRWAGSSRRAPRRPGRAAGATCAGPSAIASILAGAEAQPVDDRRRGARRPRPARRRGRWPRAARRPRASSRSAAPVSASSLLDGRGGGQPDGGRAGSTPELGERRDGPGGLGGGLGHVARLLADGRMDEWLGDQGVSGAGAGWRAGGSR